MNTIYITGILDEHQDLEDFLASVTVLPPTQKLTPSVELTPEEIMSYIIPPPPLQNSTENLTITQREFIPTTQSRDVVDGTSAVSTSKVIEYATFERKGPFSCCAKNKTEKNLKVNENIQPLPRRSSDEKPPERPPKTVAPERQRSHSLTTGIIPACDFPPPKLPPRGENNHQPPPHLFLPPKKPPLPPVPSLEVLRQKKSVQQMKAAIETRTASIGSPLFQRSRNVSNDLEASAVGTENGSPCLRHATAVSTPTSPHLGKSNYNF